MAVWRAKRAAIKSSFAACAKEVGLVSNALTTALAASTAAVVVTLLAVRIASTYLHQTTCRLHSKQSSLCFKHLDASCSNYMGDLELMIAVSKGLRTSSERSGFADGEVIHRR